MFLQILCRGLRKDPNEIPLPHPDKTDGSKLLEPYILWPFNWAQPDQSGVAQVPAAPFAPIFGNSWAPNKPIPGGWDPQYPSTEGLAPGVTSIAQHLARTESKGRSLETATPANGPAPGAVVPFATAPAGGSTAAGLGVLPEYPNLPLPHADTALTTVSHRAAGQAKTNPVPSDPVPMEPGLLTASQATGPLAYDSPSIQPLPLPVGTTGAAEAPETSVPLPAANVPKELQELGDVGMVSANPAHRTSAADVSTSRVGLLSPITRSPGADVRVDPNIDITSSAGVLPASSELVPTGVPLLRDPSPTADQRRDSPLEVEPGSDGAVISSLRAHGVVASKPSDTAGRDGQTHSPAPARASPSLAILLAAQGRAVPLRYG